MTTKDTSKLIINAISQAFHTLGDTLIGLGEYRCAITVYLQAIELNPTDAVAYSDLAHVLNLSDQWSGDNTGRSPLEYLDYSIRLDPSSPSAYAHRAESRRLDAHHYADVIARTVSRPTDNIEIGSLVFAALRDINQVYAIVKAKGDEATPDDFKAVVIAVYNARRLIGARGEDATGPLDDQAVRQATLQHPLVQKGIQAGKLTPDYVLKGFRTL